MHILLIEDDLDLGRALQSSLQLEGFSVQWLRRAADAPHQLDDGVLGCLLLDLSLPDGDGMALLARWRRQGNVTPVIVITARMALHERLNGLDNGADDFLVKPFAIPELVARIRAVLRRYAKQASEVWTIGALTLEPKRRLCRLHGETLNLSPREFQLLLELARDPGAVIAKGQLAQRLEPLGDAVEFSALEVHMSNLRRKIGAERIRTVRGVGYLLES